MLLTSLPVAIRSLGGATIIHVAVLSFACASGWCRVLSTGVRCSANAPDNDGVIMPRHRTIGRIPHGDDPLAYLLTWTSYGTWLPGDERSWVEKPGQIREADLERNRRALLRMTEPALLLTAEQRTIVESVIDMHCGIRRWHLHAAKCLTNHIHVVVTADRSPEVVMDQLKSWCTRRLKENLRARECTGGPMRINWWTQRGSKQSINDEEGLARAISYVLEGQ